MTENVEISWVTPGKNNDEIAPNGEDIPMIPEAKIKRWRDLTDKATPGPWVVNNPDDDYAMNALVVSTEPDRELKEHQYNIAITLLQYPLYARTKEFEENAAFIAAAREAMPALLDEVEELQTESAKFTDALMSLVKYGERVRRWIALGHVEPHWYKDFQSDVERANKVIGWDKQ